MDASRWALMTPVLDELLYVDEAGCSARLEQIRARDPDLADDIGHFLAQRTGIQRDGFLGGHALDLVVDATSGETVGSYTLERELGQGGMGTVWLARRSDGRYEGQVAIKFLDAPRFERGGIERFRREGSVLARLAHPNIARLIDAGVTDRGQPYLVLEYVDGEPIDRWCSVRDLGTRERVRLFREVLAAVAHAHSKLILHRDLKPSNILVTTDGHVKLLDFGIAKLLDESSTDAPALTQLAARALTPDYASPEQILRQPLSVASDVYSLGVVLYELLCGRRPYKLKHDSLGSLEDAIVTAEPAPPSAAASVPSQRRGLVGDIDTIVLKALKKAPADRYATANELLDDLDRHLDGLPVRARADSLWYRSRKFARRNAVFLAAGGLATTALLVGLGTALWMAQEASQQRDRALTEARRAEQERARAIQLEAESTSQARRAEARSEEALREREKADEAAQRASVERSRANRMADDARQAALIAERQKLRADEEALAAKRQAQRAEAVQSFLQDVFLASAAEQPDPIKAQQTTARELLDAGAARVRARLADTPDVQLEVLKTLGRIYSQLWLPEKATGLVRDQLEIARALHGPRSREAAEALVALTEIHSLTNAHDAGVASAAEAETIFVALGQQDARERGNLHAILAALWRERDLNAARRYGESAVRILSTWPRNPEYASALSRLGGVYLRAQDFAGAERMFRRQLEVLASIGDEANHSRGLTYSNLAVAQENLLHFHDADENYKRALAEKERVWGREHLSTAVTRGFYGYFLARFGHMREGIDLMRESLATMETQPEAMRRIVFYRVQWQLGLTELNYGWVARGAADIETALASARRQEPGSNTAFGIALFAARAAIEQGRLDDGRALLNDVESGASRGQPTALIASQLRQGWARLLVAEGRCEEALQKLAQASLPDRPANLDQINEALFDAEARVGCGDMPIAHARATSVVTALDEHGAAEALEWLRSRALVVQGRVALARHDESAAVELLRSAHASQARLLAAESPRLAATRGLLPATASAK